MEVFMTKRGTSVVPLVLGIIGAALGVPSAICAGACGAVADVGSGGSSLGSLFLWMGIIGVALGLAGGILGKKIPVLAGFFMLIGAVLTGIEIITVNILALIAGIIFLIGALFCFLQKKEKIE
jgi:hypothetical protein